MRMHCILSPHRNTNSHLSARTCSNAAHIIGLEGSMRCRGVGCNRRERCYCEREWHCLDSGRDGTRGSWQAQQLYRHVLHR
jgi:hypothetical protein